VSISSDGRQPYDFDRLERAIAELAEAHRRQRDENAALRRKLEQVTARVRFLDGQLLEANQRRTDVAKRVDELIAQLAHLEGQLASAEL
jgi:septal ring factor EnvC (AmiA/AmiB activator)